MIFCTRDLFFLCAYLSCPPHIQKSQKLRWCALIHLLSSALIHSCTRHLNIVIVKTASNAHVFAKNICMSHKRYLGVTNSNARADARKSSTPPQRLSKMLHCLGSKRNCQLHFLLKKQNCKKDLFNPLKIPQRALGA